MASLARRRVPALREAVVSLPAHGFRIVADLGTPFGLRMYRYGLCDVDVALAQRLLSPGDVFVDGGAHVGTFSLAAAVAVGSGGRVIACEPDPVTAGLLRANVALNRFSWVDVHEVALSDHAGAALFRPVGTASGLSSLVPRPGAPSTDAAGADVEVATATLDDLVGVHHGRVRLLKLDVEGAEVQALRGATRLLTGDRPDLILEVEPTHLARQGSTLGELEALLTDAGYAAYLLRRRPRGFAFDPVVRPWGRPAGGPNLFISARPVGDIAFTR
jgi:FkbM family methyltransferase